MASVTKRQKEKSRQEHRLQKEARRQERKRSAEDKPPPPEGEDPDIAGIIPGPQPPLED
ncbi:MAG: hypothetical protein U0807_15455 [Candidatus Binatia bacterium]